MSVVSHDVSDRIQMAEALSVSVDQKCREIGAGEGAVTTFGWVSLSRSIPPTPLFQLETHERVGVESRTAS